MLHSLFPRYKFLRQLLRLGIFRDLSDGVEILENLADFLKILPILLGLCQGLA